MALTYLDFELEIGPNVDGAYPVAVIKSPAGETRTTLRWPFSELQLENRLKDLQIALLSSGGVRRQVLSPAEQAVQTFGRDLFDWLFTGETRSRYDVSQERARQQRKGLRVKLWDGGSRIVRGGSFGNTYSNVRCAARYIDDDWFILIGFRVAWSPGS